MTLSALMPRRALGNAPRGMALFPEHLLTTEFGRSVTVGTNGAASSTAPDAVCADQ